MAKIAAIDVLATLTPSNSGTGQRQLRYNSLNKNLKRYRQSYPERAARAWASYPDSLEEKYGVRQLVSEYLLGTSEKVIESTKSSRSFWADRFTKASISLYGQPSTKKASQLLNKEVRLLKKLRADKSIPKHYIDFLLKTYRPILKSNLPLETAPSLKISCDQQEKVLKSVSDFLNAHYAPVFGLVDKIKSDYLTPKEIKSIFTSVLAWLERNDDTAWKKWNVIYTDGISVEVSSSSRHIGIPRSRQLASKEEVKGLIAHELLIHAMRAKNSKKATNKLVRAGLPDSLDAEEGLAILAEAAVIGKIPDKAYDRYIDIAIALGTIDGQQKKRTDLFKISYARQYIRGISEVADKTFLETLPARVWSHVDRIYRGGPGDNLNSRQAIFTKDIAYYEGYQKMVNYVYAELAKNKSVKQIYSFLVQARFDPNNPDHVKLIKDSFKKIRG